MILVGNQRGGSRNLAQHLMSPVNEQARVHQLHGFLADDLDGAFRESYGRAGQRVANSICIP